MNRSSTIDSSERTEAVPQDGLEEPGRPASPPEANRRPSASSGLRSITQNTNRPPLIRANSAPSHEMSGGDVIPTTTSKRRSAARWQRSSRCSCRSRPRVASVPSCRSRDTRCAESRRRASSRVVDISPRVVVRPFGCRPPSRRVRARPASPRDRWRTAPSTQRPGRTSD